MRLEFTGHRRVQVSLGTDDEVRRVGGDPRGGFRHNGEWDDPEGVLRITFGPVIKINRALDQNLRRDVEQHERRHFADFQRLAEQLRRTLDGLLKRGQDPDMEARWAWFQYDNCAASASFHRALQDWSVEICFQPSSPRP